MGMSPSGTLTNTPKHPHYRDTQTRLNTFTNWRVQYVQPDVLAAAGFFYIGISDYVRCYSCGGGLMRWEKGDEPWTEHSKWYPMCYHLRNRV